MANFGTIITSGEIRKEYIAASGEVRTRFGYGGEIRELSFMGHSIKNKWFSMS